MEPIESDMSPVEHEPTVGEIFSRDLDAINAVIIGMLTAENTNPQDLREAWAVRAVLAENFVDSLEPTEEKPNPRPRAQFDIMVDKAIIFETVGQKVRYLEELDTAEAFALDNYLDDMSISIGEELDEKVAELGLSAPELILKLRGIVRFLDRVYLRDLLAEGSNYEDLIGTIYRMIQEGGGNADEILTRLGVIK